MSVDKFGHYSTSSTTTTNRKGPPGVGFLQTDNGDFNINNKRLVNVGDASDKDDACTKGYIDILLGDAIMNLNLQNHQLENLMDTTIKKLNADIKLHSDNINNKIQHIIDVIPDMIAKKYAQLEVNTLSKAKHQQETEIYIMMEKLFSDLSNKIVLSETIYKNNIETELTNLGKACETQIKYIQTKTDTSFSDISEKLNTIDAMYFNFVDKFADLNKKIKKIEEKQDFVVINLSLKRNMDVFEILNSDDNITYKFPFDCKIIKINYSCVNKIDVYINNKIINLSPQDIIVSQGDKIQFHPHDTLKYPDILYIEIILQTNKSECIPTNVLIK